MKIEGIFIPNELIEEGNCFLKYSRATFKHQNIYSLFKSKYISCQDKDIKIGKYVFPHMSRPKSFLDLKFTTSKKITICNFKSIHHLLEWVSYLWEHLFKIKPPTTILYGSFFILTKKENIAIFTFKEGKFYL
jgi:hypothetical protein